MARLRVLVQAEYFFVVPMKDVPPSGMALALGVMLFVSYLLYVFNLGLHWRAFVAALRCIMQLLCLGVIFEGLFAIPDPRLVAGMAFVMLSVAALEAYQRPVYICPNMLSTFLCALLFSALPLTLILTLGVLQYSWEGWWTPRHFIPLLGMLMANSLNSVSIAVDRLLGDLSANRDTLEAVYFSYGATFDEATNPLAREAARVGLLPMVNTLSVVGLVAIPGMMTGQLLAGAPPLTAASYQIVVTFMFSSAQVLGVLVSIRLVLLGIKDSDLDVVDWSKVHFRGKRHSDWPVLLARAVWKKVEGWKGRAAAQRESREPPLLP